jgi:hypothetical protein
VSCDTVALYATPGELLLGLNEELANPVAIALNHRPSRTRKDFCRRIWKTLFLEVSLQPTFFLLLSNAAMVHSCVPNILPIVKSKHFNGFVDGRNGYPLCSKYLITRRKPIRAGQKASGTIHYNPRLHYLSKTPQSRYPFVKME